MKILDVIMPVLITLIAGFFVKSCVEGINREQFYNHQQKCFQFTQSKDCYQLKENP